MVNNSIIIQTNNRISSILTEHRKDHNTHKTNFPFAHTHTRASGRGIIIKYRKIGLVGDITRGIFLLCHLFFEE
jgi:hypothetical protein